MHPIIWTWGPFTIYSWGFALSLAVLSGLLLTQRLGRREGLSPDQVAGLALVLVIAGLLGARLFHVLFFEWDWYRAHPWDIIRINRPGLVFQGGLLLGLGAGFWYTRHWPLSFWRLADTVTPAVVLGYSLVRIGCYFNGCCYGKPTEAAWGVVFPALPGVVRHPTQLYLAFGAGLLFLYLLWKYNRRSFEGQIFLSYLLAYSGLRIGIEFWRENPLFWGPLTLAQVVGLLVLAVAGWEYIRRSRRRSGACKK